MDSQSPARSIPSCAGTQQWKGFRFRLDKAQILEVLALLAEGTRISTLAPVKGIKGETILRWLREAARHADQLETVLMQTYHLKRAQIDGLWSFVANKGEKTMRRPIKAVPSPTQPKPAKDWLYLQMVKHRDEHGCLQKVELTAIWGYKAELIKLLGKSTAYIERSNLLTRLFNARLTRRTLPFSKNVQAYQDAITWEDAYYNWVRPHKGLRVAIQDHPTCTWFLRTPAMAAGLTAHIWTVKELVFTAPLPSAKHT